MTGSRPSATAYSLITGYLHLDGGAMFGVVPKLMWERLIPPDEHNRIRLSMRSLLFKSKTDDQWCLVDCGAGDKWSPKLREIYGFEQNHVSLDQSLASVGLTPQDIRYMFVSHLHFDHNGGLTRRDDRGTCIPTFPNAVHFIHKKHWAHAMAPHERDRASFFQDDFAALKDSVDIHWVEKNQESFLGGQVKSWCTHGHTPYLMVFDVSLARSPITLTYTSDILPTASHVKVPFHMGYDLQPSVIIEEKKALYERIAGDIHRYVFLEHDAEHECIQVAKGEKGWQLSGESKKLSELLS